MTANQRNYQKFIHLSIYFFRFGINLLAWVSTVATLLASLHSVWWIFAMLEHFRFQYYLVLLIAIFTNIISRQKNQKSYLYLLWIIVLVINLVFIIPLFIISDSNPVASRTTKNTLQILHVTLQAENPQNIPKAIEFIDRQKTDILFLLEITPESLSKFQSGLKNYRLITAEPRKNSHGSAFFVAIRPSRQIEIKETEIIHLPSDSQRPILKATILDAGSYITLLHFHAIRPRSANTVAYQQVEFDALAAWSREIIQSGQNSLIVIGDFNSTPWHSDFRQLIKNSGLVNAQNGFGIQTSWHGNFPFWLRIPIDHCLHSKSLRTIRYTVGSNIGSDHLPLLVELQF